MDDTPQFQRLLQNTLLALGIGAGLVALCYFFVDQPVAFFVHRRHVDHNVELKDLTYPPPLVQAWTPLLLAVLLLRRAWGPWRRWEVALFAAGVSVILADQCRESLSFVFGRYWPDTWIDNNPSLIRNGAYGFHPINGGSAYGSFPSGHTARTVAAAAVFWCAFPRWRWACILASLAVAIGLVGMNYHFVGDVVGGAFVGGVVGAYAARCCGLDHRPQGRLA